MIKDKSKKILISIIVITLIIVLPTFMIAGTLVKYKCPDGSIYLSDTGIPQAMTDKGCKSELSIEYESFPYTYTEIQISLKAADLAVRKRACNQFCDEYYNLAKEVERTAKQRGDQVEFNRIVRYREYLLTDCKADCVDGVLKPFSKQSQMEKFYEDPYKK